MVYQGASGDLIKAAVDNGAKGIVIAVAGAGATSGTQNDGLAYAASKGVFIVNSTRTGSGRIAPPQRPEGGGGGGNNNVQVTPEQQRRRLFTIAGEDHTPIKARVLLMVALTKTTKRDELQRIFSEY
jgi:L-asparaginase